jgi:hypothetical protein
MPKVILCGISGSGKSYLKDRIQVPNWVFVENPEDSDIPPADAYILVEASIPTLVNRTGDTPQLLSRMSIQRNRLDSVCFRSHTPFLKVYSENADISKVKVDIDAFLRSQDGILDEVPESDDFSQEVQTSVFESAPEIQKEMQQYLEHRLGPNRVAHSWDTWIGVYFTPPRDEAPWTREEFNLIKTLLKEHPNVMAVDIPEKNRDGMSKSTG